MGVMLSIGGNQRYETKRFSMGQGHTLLESADIGLQSMLLVVWVAGESSAREAAEVGCHVA